MGDHDTRNDAVRMAVEAAKREALEQVATYLESVTDIQNMNVTRDDIRTYTAGIVMVLDQHIATRLEGQTVVVRADLTAQVDPDEVAQAITALRENESAKTELAALRSETDQLRVQLDAASQALANAPTAEQVQALSEQRQDLLNQLQANALVSQAWTDWVYVTPVIYPYPWIGLQQVNGLLSQAHRIYPRHAHLPLVRQVITTQSATVAPPPPGVPPTVQPPASGGVASSCAAPDHASGSGNGFPESQYFENVCRRAGTAVFQSSSPYPSADSSSACRAVEPSHASRALFGPTPCAVVFPAYGWRVNTLRQWRSQQWRPSRAVRVDQAHRRRRRTNRYRSRRLSLRDLRRGLSRY
jgi:hypothetical protein